MAALRERDWVQLRALIKIGPDIRGSLESDDVAQRLFELRPLVLEGAAGHADPHRAEEVPLVIEHGCGNAAEVAAVLLALDRDTVEADLPQLLQERGLVRDGLRCEAFEAGARVALDSGP